MQFQDALQRSPTSDAATSSEKSVKTKEFHVTLVKIPFRCVQAVSAELCKKDIC